MNEIFDEKFVHFIWDDSLEGKEGFFADGIKSLEFRVKTNSNDFTGTCHNGNDGDFPFKQNDEGVYRFFYYDPNYEVKRAYYKEGKKIQYRVKGFVDWEDYTNQNPCWDDEDREWRIKPEEEWCVCETVGHGLQAVRLNAETECAALFKGTSKECVEWLLQHKPKRMTYRQLAEWLAKGNGQSKTGYVAVTQLAYDNLAEKEKDNRELSEDYKIRRWGSDEWIEPTVREYLKDCDPEAIEDKAYKDGC